MALSIPRQGIMNKGDYERWQIACWSFIVFMMEKDPWVQAVWRGWQQARMIPFWAHRLATENPVSDATLKGLVIAIRQVQDPEDLDWFRHVVHDELKIPYIWVPEYLRQAFQAWTAKELKLPVPTDILLSFPMGPDFPTGKGPTAHGQDIMRRVGWLYLTKYWQKPTPIKPLAKDWATHIGRPGEDLRWQVKQGIKQAEALLDLARFEILPK